MTNILTADEGAVTLRCATADPDMLALLPLVDKYIENATGRNWALDASIYPEAKSAARMLLVRWHEDPGGMAAGSVLNFGLMANLVQLEALALTLETSGVPDEALALDASFPASGDQEVAITVSPVLVFNHAMDTTATSNVRLENAAGSTVASTNSLDATKKILTINPTSNLSAASSYTVVIDNAADIYGATLETEFGFITA